MQVKKEKKVVESGEKLNCSWISVKESYLKLDDWDLTIIVSSETDDIENDPRVGHMSVAFTFLSEELHTVSFDWFLSGLEWIIYLEFCY